MARRDEEAATDPMRARFVKGLAYVSDTSKTVNIQHPSEVFPELTRCKFILMPEPSLFLRLGLLEAVQGTQLEGTAQAASEVRYGLSEGCCMDPGRLLFGRGVPMMMLAARLGMEGHAGFKEGVSLEHRLNAELDVLTRIGKGIGG